MTTWTWISHPTVHFKSWIDQRVIAVSLPRWIWIWTQFMIAWRIYLQQFEPLHPLKLSWLEIRISWFYVIKRFIFLQHHNLTHRAAHTYNPLLKFQQTMQTIITCRLSEAKSSNVFFVLLSFLSEWLIWSSTITIKEDKNKINLFFSWHKSLVK